MGKAATPFSVFVARWQEDVLIHKKASTASAVKSHINTSLLPEFGKLAMGDLDSERVQTFLNRVAGKMSPKSVKNVWTTLRIMWNSAVAWKYVTGELRVELPKARKLRMRCYNVDEVKRILANTHGAEQIFFWLAAETGARVGELIALRVSDVNLESMYVDVSKALWCGTEDAPKTEAGNRRICLSPQLGAALKEHLAGALTAFCFKPRRGILGMRATYLIEYSTSCSLVWKSRRLTTTTLPKSSARIKPSLKQLGVKSGHALWACIAFATPMQQRWTRWESRIRFASNASAIAETV